MYRDVLLAVDLANPATQDKAVASAVACVRAFGARLHVMTVVPEFGMSMVAGFFPKDYEKNALAEADRALHAYVAEKVPKDIAVQHIVGHGTIYREILHYAEKTSCDLIVLAAHRPEFQDYLLGPNAARVVRHARASVLVVRD